jgi:hypothetical protein
LAFSWSGGDFADSRQFLPICSELFAGSGRKLMVVTIARFIANRPAGCQSFERTLQCLLGSKTFRLTLLTVVMTLKECVA